MDFIRVIVAVAFCVLLFIEGGLSIQCHQCNSAIPEQSDCGDMPSDKYLNECPAEYSMCRKMIQSIEGDSRTIRQCALENEASCQERTGTFKIKVKYCHCKDDGCNTASQSFSPSKLLLLLPLAILGFLRL